MYHRIDKLFIFKDPRLLSKANLSRLRLALKYKYTYYQNHVGEDSEVVKGRRHKLRIAARDNAINPAMRDVLISTRFWV